MKYILRTCKSRIDNIEYLINSIPNLILSIDSKEIPHSAYENFLDAMILSENKSSLHLEDDIELCDNFIEKVENEVLKRPNDIIQFFSMRKADLEIGSRYESGAKFCMNQCFYLPEGLPLQIYNHSNIYLNNASEKEKLGSPYDLMMADFFKKNKIKYWVVVPNLVNHKITVSIIDKRRSSKRQSLTFKP